MREKANLKIFFDQNNRRDQITASSTVKAILPIPESADFAKELQLFLRIGK
jgi:hypothetical protein